MRKTIIATNWSSTGNGKTRNVKAGFSKTDDFVRISLTDLDTKDFMKVGMDEEGAVDFARSLLAICKHDIEDFARQRDELLTALKAFVAYADDVGDDSTELYLARVAIAKCEGGAQ